MQTKAGILLFEYPKATFFGTICAFITIALYLNGCFLPFIEVDKFWIFINKVSMYSTLIILFKTHDYFLWSIIFVFSVCVPIFKFCLILACPYVAPKLSKKILYHTESVGKWAMLDVFVLSVIVVTIRLGAVMHVQVHAGIIYFSAAILMTMVLVRYFHWLSGKAIKNSS